MRRDFEPVEAKVNAKINIGLQIVRKRPDGYHDLQTVFYPTDFFTDYLRISPSEKEIAFQMESQEDLGSNDNNLCVKAFRLLQKDFGISHVEIFLKKGIPSGAGLGGGSADAAFTVRALNELFALGLSHEEMERLVAPLGADCAFFIQNRPRFAEGIGDLFSEVPEGLIDTLQGRWLLLVKPDCAVSTRAAYSGIRPSRPETPLREALTRPIRAWQNCVCNDFEDSVFPQFPEIAKWKQRLLELGAIYAAMSGSGATVFGIFEQKPDLSGPIWADWHGFCSCSEIDFRHN
jgi:4-diphosphocytidyl-2-C-methyl-D-erythritol kinase